MVSPDAMTQLGQGAQLGSPNMVHRDPLAAAVVPARRDPRAVHQVNRDLSPLTVGQHPVGRGRWK